ncbi:hypothetical protein M2475_000364 [Breznakia sp. PF5-3]|uniref:hypothetical protein n=1 Tax=unclassified Breznakia TaxID=2623764 RepID=UPI00240688BA|nr:MULTISPECIES: hypothetical protein [unclassified Breznakia]MDF9824016.1 hypothetical protein [Breznakia sp. PM6-1]MDF9834815.1 hypothetical protein [Breznakia sp. PF5-3]MDF9838134.1 hypothetical protein [Breznakia sp. PFB2-8]MDF9860120.1 hypothetical protein [Breznakia sp. PH5-24]
MNKKNYKTYIDEINENNKLKEHLQEISNEKVTKNNMKPIMALAIVVCLMIISVFTLQKMNSNPKKEDISQTKDAGSNSRKGDDGLIYLKKDAAYPNNLEISDIALYDTLPVYENIRLDYSQDGRIIQSITDIVSQEQFDKQYAEPIEKILNLDSKDRTITDDATEQGVKTSITYSYPNGVSFSIDAHIYVTIWFKNPKEYGIEDSEAANNFAIKILEELTGNPYEPYTYTSAFDTPPESNGKGYVTRSDVNDMMKSFERMDYDLFEGDNGKELSISLPNNFTLTKVADKKMISTKQALENLKNDYACGPIQIPYFDNADTTYQTIIQNALSDETYKDVLGIELYDSRHWSTNNYVYPSYLVLIKIPDDIETNAAPGEIPCIVAMVSATELMPTPEE